MEKVKRKSWQYGSGQDIQDHVSKVSPEGEDWVPLAGVGVVSEQRPHHGGPHEPGHVGRGVGDREHEAGVVGGEVQYAGD